MALVGSNTSNVLDFALEAFSCASEADLYRAVEAAPRALTKAVLERYRTWASSGTQHFPDLWPGELRPYFVSVSNYANWAHGGLASLGRLHEQEEVWAFADSLKHRLLYCHSLATDDPMGWLLLMDSETEDPEIRARLLNYCNLLLHLAPLIRKGILCFKPASEYLPPETDPALKWIDMMQLIDEADGLALIGADNVLGWYEEVKAHAPDHVQEKWQSFMVSASGREVLALGAVQAASERVGRSLAASLLAPAKLTTYLPFRFDVDLLVSYEKSIARQRRQPAPASDVPDYDNWLLSKLLDVALPGLSELAPEELVQIRSQSEEFEAWRRTLADTIKHADGVVPARIMNRDAAILREIKERLTDGKSKLEASMSRSALLKGARTGSVTMIGGLVGMGASLLIDPTLTTTSILSTLAMGGAAGGVNAAAEAVQGSSSGARQAALGHYVALLR